MIHKLNIFRTTDKYKDNSIIYNITSYLMVIHSPLTMFEITLWLHLYNIFHNINEQSFSWNEINSSNTYNIYLESIYAAITNIIYAIKPINLNIQIKSITFKEIRNKLHK